MNAILQEYINQALIESVLANKLDEVKEDIDIGADPNFINGNWQSSLFCANGVQMIKFLLDNGANINNADKYGNSLLITSAGIGRKEIVEELLQAGRNVNNVNAINSYGETALIAASKNGLVEICGLLLKNGADINIRDKKGFDALHYAVNCLNKEVVELLLSNSKINLREGSGSPLFSVLNVKVADSDEKKGHLQKVAIMQLLLDKGAKVNVRGEDGNTPLIIAAGSGLLAGIDLLLVRGAEINSCNNYGFSALVNAIMHEEGAAAKKLIEGGAYYKFQLAPIKKLARSHGLSDILSFIKKRESEK